jgi:type I restriction enzyme S subunit
LKIHRPEIERLGRGATFKEVSKKIVEEIQIPLPPLPEQKRIAAILDAADALRAKRRESLAQLDTLLQSTFLDMFGDPVTNPKGWEISSLDRVLTVEHGFAFKSEYFSDHGEYIVLTPGSFHEAGGYRNQGTKTKYYSVPPPDKYILPAGSLLVAMTEQAPGLLGSPIFVPEDNKFLHNQRLGLIRMGKNVTAHFLYHLFNTDWVRGELQRTSTGTKVKHTSPTKIGAVTSIVPPLNLQNRFATIVESIERQKSRLRAHLAELDTLFASLQARAFNGEL